MNRELLFACIDRFEKSSLDYLSVEEAGLRIELRKPAGGLYAGRNEAGPAESLGYEGSKEVLEEIRAPIVGVFYAAAEPGGKPFVREGDRAAEGDTLCMLEAMKMMNEVKAPVSGIVRKIGGVDGEMVEYGQVLFEVEPC